MEEEFQELKTYVVDSLDEFKYIIEDLQKEIKELQKCVEELSDDRWEDECYRIESDLTDEIGGVQDDVTNILTRLDDIETELSYQ